MHRFKPGDYVRPINPHTGLPLGSVWVVRRYDERAYGAMELDSVSVGAGRYPPWHVKGKLFNERDFELRPLSTAFALASGITPLGTIAPATVANVEKVDPIKAAENLVAAAESTLDAAKERAREARKEAKAKAKAEAKAKAREEAASKVAQEALNEYYAINARLHKDRCLAEATLELIAEISRLQNGGPEKPAAASIAGHVVQLQPLAKSYGYKISKPSMVALVHRA